MDDLLFHGNRLLRMLRHKGLGYAWRYAWFNLWFHCPPVGRFLANRLNLYRYPTCLEVEVTTRCNLRCIMCEHTYWKEKGRDMSFDQFRCIVDQFPVIRWIGLTGIGTAFLNRDFLKMLRYVKEARNAYVEIYDSCHMLDAEIARELVEAGLDRLIVSLDGATAGTYEKIRVGSNFERVLGNIRGVLAAREAAGRHYPEITFHYIVSALNQHEMREFIRLVHSFGLGPTTQVAFTVILHEFPEIKGMVPALSEAEVASVNRVARECGIRVNWNKNVIEKECVGKCTEWMMPFIFVDGTVIPCCAGNEANQREFQRTFSLGNVFHQHFREIWEGPAYRRLREGIRHGRMPDACRLCSIYRP